MSFFNLNACELYDIMALRNKNNPMGVPKNKAQDF